MQLALRVDLEGLYWFISPLTFTVHCPASSLRLNTDHNAHPLPVVGEVGPSGSGNGVVSARLGGWFFHSVFWFESRYRWTSPTVFCPNRVEFVGRQLAVSECGQDWLLDAAGGELVRAASSQPGGSLLRFKMACVSRKWGAYPPRGGHQAALCAHRRSATMRRTVLLAVAALCALTDYASAVARAGGPGARVGKSRGGDGRSSNGSGNNTGGGDRDRLGETPAAVARRKRDKAAVNSHDGARMNGRNPSAVVIGAIREERGHQVKKSQQRRGKPQLPKDHVACFISRGTNGQQSYAKLNAGAPTRVASSVQPSVRVDVWTHDRATGA